LGHVSASNKISHVEKASSQFIFVRKPHDPPEDCEIDSNGIPRTMPSRSIAKYYEWPDDVEALAQPAGQDCEILRSSFPTLNFPVGEDGTECCQDEASRVLCNNRKFVTGL
jgi:hypothetical protein